jgi:hypothetical protein
MGLVKGALSRGTAGRISSGALPLMTVSEIAHFLQKSTDLMKQRT